MFPTHDLLTTTSVGRCTTNGSRKPLHFIFSHATVSPFFFHDHSFLAPTSPQLQLCTFAGSAVLTVTLRTVFTIRYCESAATVQRWDTCPSHVFLLLFFFFPYSTSPSLSSLATESTFPVSSETYIPFTWIYSSSLFPSPSCLLLYLFHPFFCLFTSLLSSILKTGYSIESHGQLSRIFGEILWRNATEVKYECMNYWQGDWCNLFTFLHDGYTFFIWWMLAGLHLSFSYIFYFVTHTLLNPLVSFLRLLFSSLFFSSLSSSPSFFFYFLFSSHSSSSPSSFSVTQWSLCKSCTSFSWKQ